MYNIPPNVVGNNLNNSNNSNNNNSTPNTNINNINNMYVYNIKLDQNQNKDTIDNKLQNEQSKSNNPKSLMTQTMKTDDNFNESLKFIRTIPKIELFDRPKITIPLKNYNTDNR